MTRCKLFGPSVYNNPTMRTRSPSKYRVLLSKGDTRGAEAQLATLARRYPMSASIYALRGRVALLGRDFVAARASFESALNIDPLDLEALTGLAALPGDANAALTRVQAALVRMPDSADHLLIQSRLLLMTGRPEEAEKAVRRVLSADANHLEARWQLGETLVRSNRLDAAVSEFEKLVPLSPNPAGVLTRIGEIFEKRGQVEDAQKRYEQAISIEPRIVNAANNLAFLYAEHGGNLDTALQLAQNAKASVPDNPYVNDTLGWVYYKKGLHDEAARTLKESVARIPDVAAFNYHYGLAAAKSQDSAEARRTLEHALRLNPKSPYATEARAELTSLTARGL